MSRSRTETESTMDESTDSIADPITAPWAPLTDAQTERVLAVVQGEASRRLGLLRDDFHGSDFYAGAVAVFRALDSLAMLPRDWLETAAAVGIAGGERPDRTNTNPGRATVRVLLERQGRLLERIADSLGIDDDLDDEDGDADETDEDYGADEDGEDGDAEALP